MRATCIACRETIKLEVAMQKYNEILLKLKAKLYLILIQVDIAFTPFLGYCNLQPDNFLNSK